MRIGMILDKNFPPDPRVENEASTLVQEGHEVFLFCLIRNGEAHHEEFKGVQLRRYPTNRVEFKLSALAYTIGFYHRSMRKKIHHFLIENKIEAIHIHDMVIAQAAFEANKNLNLPVVLDLHENRPEIMRHYPHMDKLIGKMLISIEKWKLKEEELVKRANKVIVVTSESAEDLVLRTGISNNKVVVVPNTVKRDFFEKFIENRKIFDQYKSKFVLLYLGDTGLRRGLMTVIRALKILKDRILDPKSGEPILKLVIIGKSSTDHLLLSEIKKDGLESMVDIKGWMDVSEFPSYIIASDIGICPLHRNKHHDTTYANKLFQYMSFSKPLLVSDATAQRELVKNSNSGLVHEAKNEADFADKVMELYENKRKAKKMGDNGKQFLLEKYIWEKVSLNLIEMYKDLGKN